MKQGLSRVVTNEMSHDEFMETFGSASPSPTTAETMIFSSTSEDMKRSHGSTVSEGSNETSHGYGQGVEGKYNMRKEMKSTSREPMRALKTRGYLSSSQENILSESDNVAPKSKFSSIANRLARRSFRLGSKKKSPSEGSITIESNSSLRPPTPTRLGAFLFKRSKSVSRQASSDCTITSFRTLPDNDVIIRPIASTPSRLEARHRRSKVTRSMSLSPSTSLLVKPNSEQSKRHSTFVSSRWEEAIEGETVDGKQEVDLLQKILEQKGQILEQQRKFHEKSLAIRSEHHDGDMTPESEITKKYEAIRQNEEMRVVAVVSLLNRRRNSLKIKCKQFEKNVTSSDNGRAKFIQERLLEFRRKLSVVEQCIEEHKDAVKLSVAKLELKCCLDLFQLGLQKDEELFSNGAILKANKIGKRHATITTAPSCETLGSLDDTSVFGDSASASAMSLNFNQSSPIPQSKRQSGSTYRKESPGYQKDVSLDESCGKTTIDDAGRNRSTDFGITSDCDSGFDNGDTLSRSDISLYGNLSKSTGSIVSSCSYSPTPSIKRDNFHKKPMMNVSSGDTGKSTLTSRLAKRSDLTTHGGALARIEDFEVFAEKRKRCISNNGKLVPLKGGC